MRRFPTTLSALAILAFLLANTAAPRQAEATSALAYSVEEMARLSAAVVIATVGSDRLERHPVLLRPVTVTTLRIERVLAGAAPPSLEIRQWKGTLDGRTTAIAGDPNLEPGQRSLFFLRQVNGQWFLTALSQALFTMGPESDPRLRRQVDIALYATNPDGTLRPVPDAPAAPTTLSAMEAALAGVALTGPEVTE